MIAPSKFLLGAMLCSAVLAISHGESKGSKSGSTPSQSGGTGDGSGSSTSDSIYKLTISNKIKAESIFEMDTFIESNINYATDGGIYAELIANRAFQNPAGTMNGFNPSASDEIGHGTTEFWTEVGKADLALVSTNPLSDALPQSATITYNSQKTAAFGSGIVSNRAIYGIANEGFFGIPIKAQKYILNFWMRSDAEGDAVIHTGLYSKDMSVTYVEDKTSRKLTKEWTMYTVKLVSSKSSDKLDNIFAIFLEVGNKNPTVQVNLISLMPPCWKGTVARPDVAQAILDFAPKSIRYPGGNDLQGPTLNARFDWKQTIGPLHKRKGRLGNWHGWNTEGFGLVEAMNFITAAGAKPIVGVWAGLTGDGKVVAQNELGPYVRDAVEMLHFLLDTKGEWADMRVKNGGPREPYPIEKVMIGNEGQLPATKDTYGYRWAAFSQGIQRDFPHLTLIATAPVDTTTDVDSLNDPLYGTPSDFVSKYNLYDRLGEAFGSNKDLKHYNLEFAVINSGQGGPDENIWIGPHRLHHSILQGSLAEAIFILGMEKNGDIIGGSAYAPELANDSNDGAHTQSTPGALEFDVTKVVKSTSYLIQQGISRNPFDQIHEVETSFDVKNANIYYSAGSNKRTKQYVVRLVNYDASEKVVSVEIEGLSVRRVNRYQIHNDDPNISNDLEHPNNILPKEDVLPSDAFSQGSIKITLPKYSFTTLTIST
ncbi:glycoside hydrolase [Violaceomyces palustris]|uniref:Glycoside hydrolase n=1 Tax=Violaceomyces palustris TaxID=1673888 RepID=A0ACD0NWM1_9BASI|nr:glycoside hydrolase [Violaceomyces palustris]